MSEKTKTRSFNKKPTKKATAAAIMAGLSLLGGNVNRADAANKPPKPAEIAQLQEQLRQEQAKSKKESAQIHKLASYIAMLAGVREDVVLGHKLKKVESLPGYGQKVTPEQTKQLADSSVHIIYKNRYSDQWMDLCTATKISYQGRDALLSARHCFTDAVAGADLSTFTDGRTSHNYVRTTDNIYAISKPDKSGRFMHEPLAYINGISLSENNDYALLDGQIGMKGGPIENPMTWEDIPAISYDESFKPPKIGEEAVFYGYAFYNGFRPVTGKGIYLGRYNEYYDKSITGAFDLFGISPNEPGADTCNYGDSGSSAITAGGFVTGPLSYRVNIAGYPSGKPNGNETPDPLSLFRLEQQTGIDVSRFVTFCKFAVRNKNPQDISRDTIKSLFDGFDHYAQDGRGMGGDPTPTEGGKGGEAGK